MKARDFDEKFDRGEDITAELDLTQARRKNLEPRRINVHFPAWMVESLDRPGRPCGQAGERFLPTKGPHRRTP